MVAWVRVRDTVLRLDHLSADAVEELAVVRDEDEGELGRLLAQVALEPLHRVEVHVVGRLVEQQHLRQPRRG